MSSCILFIFTIFPIVLSTRNENTINIVNLEVQSQFDLRNQLLHVKHIVRFVNNGTQNLADYLFATDTAEDEELHDTKFYNENGLDLKFKQLNSTLFEVNLDKSIKPNEEYTVMVKKICANKILPAHSAREIDEDQIMKFKGNLQFFSPYKTIFYKNQYLLLNDSLIEATREAIELTKDDVLVYTFHDVGIYTIEPIEIFFVNNNPFLVVRDLERTIDVSHYGVISIEERVYIENNGAKLEGPYTHYLTVQKKGGTNWLFTHLPASANNIKFFDEIGNNSQSMIHYFFDYITLQFRTRYPLLGGWKTRYILKYDVPVHEYLFIMPTDHYFLQIRGVDYVLNDVVIEQATVRIVLPEGAHFKKVHLWSVLKAEEESSSFTGLCVLGRPTIVLKGSNLFDKHITPIQIEYFFNSWYLLRAPLLISFYYQFIFVVFFFVKYVTVI